MVDGGGRWWVVVVGAIGLAAFAGGSLLAALPRVDVTDEDALAALISRRTAILAGAVLSVLGGALLLWPVAAVSGRGDRWAALDVYAVASWVLGFAFLVLGVTAPATVAWRDPTRLPLPVVRLGLDLGHLATWSLSAPLGAVSTVATTAVAVRGDGADGAVAALLVVLAGAKVLTVAIEVAGVGRRTGPNAGGWAAGTSGHVTVGWFAALLLALAVG